MREIKFRAWDKTENKMARNVQELRFNSNGLYRVVLNHMGFEFKKRTNDVDLMQYTGLKDKNGKEIYEWDIVEAIRYDGLAVTGIVGFRDCSFVISTGYQTIYTWMDYQIEIIGNIHEGEVHP